jgi:predicted nucleic acid-binding protein
VRRRGRGPNCISVEGVGEACFVDTNILVYAIEGNDPVRSPRASELMLRLTLEDSLRTSTQVIQELYCIVVAAGLSGAKILYTEDLQHGQVLLGVRIVNPFR